MKLVDDSGRLTADGEALHDQAIAANPNPEQLIAVLVDAEWLSTAEEDAGTDRTVLPAYLWRDPDDGSINLWNGFVQPLFARPEAERLVEAQQRLVAADQEGIYENLRFDGDTLVTVVAPVWAGEGEPESSTEGTVINGTRLWWIGDGWTWTEVGGTLERADPFHAWLAAQKAAGRKLGTPVGNPALLAQFAVEQRSEPSR